MDQKNLFGEDDTQQHVRDLDARRRSRLSDPITSIEGERHILKKMTKLHTAVLAAADLMPRTARELAERACSVGGEVESFRKRARELADRKLLRVAGRRRCKHTNRAATCYVLNKPPAKLTA